MHAEEQDQPAPAFYALDGGGWRDWWTLLHPPYTVWHLSYVALGAAASPNLRLDRLIATLVAFFLGVGIAAHALDERNGHPLRTALSDRTLAIAATVALAGAVAIGALGVTRAGIGLVPFITFGVFIAWAYNAEAFGGRFHNDAWFAFAWGAFPALTASFANSGTLRIEGVLVAAACYALSIAQRSLSTPVRALRRRTREVKGQIVRSDGSIERIDRAALTAAPERALRALSLAMPLLATAAVVARVLSR